MSLSINSLIIYIILATLYILLSAPLPLTISITQPDGTSQVITTQPHEFKPIYRQKPSLYNFLTSPLQICPDFFALELHNRTLTPFFDFAGHPTVVLGIPTPHGDDDGIKGMVNGSLIKLDLIRHNLCQYYTTGMLTLYSSIGVDTQEFYSTINSTLKNETSFKIDTSPVYLHPIIIPSTFSGINNTSISVTPLGSQSQGSAFTIFNLPLIHRYVRLDILFNSASWYAEAIQSMSDSYRHLESYQILFHLLSTFLYNLNALLSTPLAIIAAIPLVYIPLIIHRYGAGNRHHLPLHSTTTPSSYNLITIRYLPLYYGIYFSQYLINTSTIVLTSIYKLLKGKYVSQIKNKGDREIMDVELQLLSALIITVLTPIVVTIWISSIILKITCWGAFIVQRMILGVILGEFF